MRRWTGWVLLAATLGCSSGGETRFASRLSDSRDVSDLAELSNDGGITVVTDGLSLHADYRDSRAGRVTLYVINGTTADVTLPTQDGDLFLKLEALQDGRWRRIQSHTFSDCGLSYTQLSLPAGEFVTLDGWYPTETQASGEPVPVRYRSYGDVKLVSNVGSARIEADEAAKARFDQLALQRASASTLRAVLLEGAANHVEHAQDVRRWALERLAKLPRAKVLDLLEDLLAEDLAQADLELVLEAMGAIAPDRLGAYVGGTLLEDSARRTAALDGLRFMPRIDDAKFRGVLLAQALDPSTPALPFIVDYIGGYRTPDVKAALKALATKRRYPATIRIRAQYQLEQWFGDEVLDVRFAPVGNYSDGHRHPVMLDVTLTNSGSAPVSFAYSRPSDILKLYLTTTRGTRTGDNIFFPPRRGVRWLTRPDPHHLKHVKLAPGEEHRLQIAVMDYFDLEGRPDDITVWLSVALPGHHRVPQLCGGGSGIHPVTATSRR